jgi:quercetin dioxygenase-like cupin family protein
MIVTRWQAPIIPSKEQVFLILESENLDPYEEVFEPNTKISDHRHPFTEVRVVLSGEMIFNISGNQFVLRPGDRLEIPANTKHSHVSQSGKPCVCICAQRVI